jgi:urea transport system substrate-binding protein
LKDQLRLLGATIAGEAFLPLGSVNVAAVVQRAKKSGATMTLNTTNGDTNLAFIRELRAAGLTSGAVLLLSFSLDQTGYRELDPSLVAGDRLAWNYFEAFDSHENREFLRLLHERFGPRPVTDPDGDELLRGPSLGGNGPARRLPRSRRDPAWAR